MTKRDTLLAIAPRNSNDPVNNASGNHAQVPVATDKSKSNPVTNKCEQSAMTALWNKELKTGSPISLMSRTMSKNSSCSKCWGLRGRIFKVLEPNGLGKSYLL